MMIFLNMHYKTTFLNNNIKVAPGSAFATVADRGHCNLTVLYTTHADSANIVQD